MTGPSQTASGVPTAGHITSTGVWHPGVGDGCVRCDIERPAHVLPSRASSHGQPIRTGFPYANGDGHLNGETGTWHFGRFEDCKPECRDWIPPAV